jgi:hypothetical protein
MRHLEWVEPDFQPARLVLLESDSTEVISYLAPRSFKRIERHGRMFRLNGRDRETGELIYLPEVDEMDLIVLDEGLMAAQAEAMAALDEMDLEVS